MSETSALRKRGRLGCLNCRRRRKKCDEIKPACSRCKSKAESCEWDTGIRFRMHNLSSGQHKVGTEQSISSTSGTNQLDLCSPKDLDNSQFTQKDLDAVRQIIPNQAELGESPHYAFTDTQLGSLDYLTSRSETWSVDHSLSIHNISPSESWNDQYEMAIPSVDVHMAESPDIWTIYYPNAEYRELHTTLHKHILETARNTGSSRQTPSRDTVSDEVEGRSTSPSIDKEMVRVLPKRLNVSQKREVELWANYLGEIAPWLDMFDNQHHFQYTLPVMAKSAGHLRLAILALSARQMERKNPSHPYVESLALYQEAISLIVQELHSLNTAVIASCVLLCVLEMMSSSPRDWSRHLDGCVILLQMAEVNGVVGGMRQAIFWCFARMDVWGGFLSERAPKIPVNQWLEQSSSMSATVSQFRINLCFDNYANYSVFLCASVLVVLTKKRTPLADEQEGGDSYLAEWKAMFELLDDWYARRPEKMQPLLAYPTEIDDPNRPFPIVLYGNASAINGNILFHTSALLMLQLKPKYHKLSKGHKSILWHARQICGIATSNNNHGAWINALQPLWIAGKVMSNPLEHKIIIDILHRIETETGWATSWRAEDLKNHWGTVD